MRRVPFLRPRYVAIAAVATVASQLTSSAQALDAMAESPHFKTAYAEAMKGNLVGVQREILGESSEDLVGGQDLFSDIITKGGLDQRAAYRIKIEVEKYFNTIASKRDRIDAIIK